MKSQKEFDVVVVGAGFSGMSMLYLLREQGFSVRVYETASDVGGVWNWNRYPGARCDTYSIYYSLMLTEELYKGWTWSSRYPEQAEIMQYMHYVAEKLDVRKDIQFNTRITSAHYDDANNLWEVETNDGEKVSAKYIISAVGTLSASNKPNIKGMDSFKGEIYHTAKWPHHKVDFKGKRVGIIGTGSSGVQSTPVIAEEAEHLTVFQRTAAYTVPANHYKYPLGYDEELKENFHELKESCFNAPWGFPTITYNRSALDDTPERRNEVYEESWQTGGLDLMTKYNDIRTNMDANSTLTEFLRNKIREKVKDPVLREKLVPNYPYGGKRIILDTNYFETFDRENVSLVDVKESPIQEITSNGIRTTTGEHELDIIIFATGFDSFTGPYLRMDIRGKNGVPLKEKWDGGANLKTYLGVGIAGYPNFLMMGGPLGPFYNGPVQAEYYARAFTKVLTDFRDRGVATIEVTEEAEEAWANLVNEAASRTIFKDVDSWFNGANIEGKPRQHLLYNVGNFVDYTERFNKVIDNNYQGFNLTFEDRSNRKQEVAAHKDNGR